MNQFSYSFSPPVYTTNWSTLFEIAFVCVTAASVFLLVVGLFMLGSKVKNAVLLVWACTVWLVIFTLFHLDPGQPLHLKKSDFGIGSVALPYDRATATRIDGDDFESIEKSGKHSQLSAYAAFSIDGTDLIIYSRVHDNTVLPKTVLLYRFIRPTTN